VVSTPHGVRIRKRSPFWPRRATTTPEGVMSTPADVGNEFGGVGSDDMVVVVITTGSVEVVTICTPKSLETGGVVVASEQEVRMRAVSAAVTILCSARPGLLLSRLR
jgi:hypothetical protein